MKASVVVTGALLGLALAQSCPDPAVNGYASVGSGTTGGGNAASVTVTNAADLRTAAKASGARVIVVKGTIDTSGVVDVAADKTIIGQDASATIIGGFRMDRVQNVIIKNLNIRAGAAADALASTRSHHIWYDHLNVYDAADGLLDITKESDFQTVSWCKFWYSNAGADHRLASLIGSGGGSEPNDEGKLHVTFHHNWWAENVDQRMPRVMYGEGHIYNNFFNSPGNSYCVGFGSYGSVLLENNYFKGVKNPHQFMYNVYAYAAAEGNVYDSVTGAKDTGKKGSEHVAGQESFTADPFKPPYSFSLDAASALPDLVKRCSGPRASGTNPPATTAAPKPTTTTKAPATSTTTTSAGNGGNCAAMWGQCGGDGFSGPKCCAQGACKVLNQWYHQCT
ncbi:polysaccharide lyase family 1 protein [Paramyrothecium foliicola]|nr:polysaccharide lyase family 1 protein [Paramyrothecium foliicola]